MVGCIHFYRIFSAMKKQLLLLVSILSITIASFSQASLTADQILSTAQAKAKKENKSVFLIFHASWCGWCHRMDTAMADPKVSKYFNDNYVITHMTVMESKDKKGLENPGALELMQKYSGEGSGIPFWLVYDKAGSVAADSREVKADGTVSGNVGCPAAENEVAHFINVIKKTSSINATGLDLINKRFRKIETGD
ncbi:MAG: thioredoxin family protein [Chitinophagaceae bacterium]|nr:MAG: thioredoxin family protein [Chitinophagaceae bacterium]